MHALSPAAALGAMAGASPFPLAILLQSHLGEFVSIRGLFFRRQVQPSNNDRPNTNNFCTALSDLPSA